MKRHCCSRVDWLGPHGFGRVDWVDPSFEKEDSAAEVRRAAENRSLSMEGTEYIDIVVCR